MADGPPMTSPESSSPALSPVEPVSPAGPRLWGLKDLLLFIGFAFVALPLSYAAALFGYAALAKILGERAESRGLDENTFFLVAVQSVYYTVLFGFIRFLVVVVHRQPFWAALKWRRLRARGTIACLMGGVLLAAAIELAPRVLPEKQSFPLERLFTSPAAAYTLGAFAILIAPFMEELIFRGVIFSVLERRTELWFTIVCTAVLFAGLHVPEYWGAWNHALLILVVGLVFSLARGLTGSLTPSVLLHVAYNAAQIAVLYEQTHRFHDLHALLGGRV